jgi:hypothetical protein
MLELVKALVLAMLPNTSLTVEARVPLTAAGPPVVSFALGSLMLVTVSLTVEPLTSVLAVTCGEVPSRLL